MRPRLKQINEGDKFGHLVVLREVGRDKRGIALIECLCDCGQKAILRINHLTRDRRFCSRSCKLLSDVRSLNLTGEKFGSWSVIGLAEHKGRSSFWHCRCKCGFETVLRGAMLTSGQSTKCRTCASVDRRLNRSPEDATEARRKCARESACRHSARVKANKIKYLNRLSHATPDWLTPDHWHEMDAIYAEAKLASRKTGIRHEVDHVHPLNGKVLCGLHVPWNLQVLTQAENVAKSNRYAELSGD